LATTIKFLSVSKTALNQMGRCGE